MVFLLTIISCFLSVPAECPDCPGQKSVPVGPELLIDYAPRGKHTNPVDKFMYFIPLVAPAAVAGFADPNTTLNAAITTHRILEQPENFKVSCEFEVKGAGAYTAVFDPDQMIAFYRRSAGKSKPLRFMLYSIRMSGPCSGVIEISGLIQRGEKKVENVLVRFNRDGSQSSVFVSMYDVPCIQDRYAYKNRYNEQIARINSLCFTRSPGDRAEMGVEVCSVRPANGEENLLSSIKATLANWFLPPTPIAFKGNNTMLDFGKALVEKQPAFVFPFADNLRQSLAYMEIKARQNTDTKQTLLAGGKN